MENEFTLTIRGFKTAEQVKEFASWYEGQGEQDASVWFECRQEEGILDVKYMNVDLKKSKFQIDENNNMDLYLKI